MPRNRRKCSNKTCRCICEDEGKYCSEECEEATEDEQYCDCPHDECHHSGLCPESVPIPH